MEYFQEVVEAIERAGFDVRSYSGRGMYGKCCLGVSLDSGAALWELAYQLGCMGMDIGSPKTDSLGRGLIAYWPSIKWEGVEA